MPVRLDRIRAEWYLEIKRAVRNGTVYRAAITLCSLNGTNRVVNVYSFFVRPRRFAQLHKTVLLF